MLPRTERDIPIGLVALDQRVICLIPLGRSACRRSFRAACCRRRSFRSCSAAIVYIVVAGFLVAAACGYMAGTDRLVEQSGVGTGDSRGHRRLATAARDRRPLESGGGSRIGGLRACSLPRCCCASRRSPTTTCKTSRPANSSTRRRGGSRPHWFSASSWASLVIPPILDLLNRAYGFVGRAAPRDRLATAARTAGNADLGACQRASFRGRSTGG